MLNFEKFELENGLKVIVEDGVAKLPDRSSFAGSVATADRLVNLRAIFTAFSTASAPELKRADFFL